MAANKLCIHNNLNLLIKKNRFKITIKGAISWIGKIVEPFLFFYQNEKDSNKLKIGDYSTIRTHSTVSSKSIWKNGSGIFQMLGEEKKIEKKEKPG